MGVHAEPHNDRGMNTGIDQCMEELHPFKYSILLLHSQPADMTGTGRKLNYGSTYSHCPCAPSSEHFGNSSVFPSAILANPYTGYNKGIRCEQLLTKAGWEKRASSVENLDRNKKTHNNKLRFIKIFLLPGQTTPPRMHHGHSLQ